MKPDYHYLKKMLLKMEENPQHTFVNLELATEMGVNLNKIEALELDKFVGHLSLLQDQACIESPGNNLGFSQNLNDHWVIVRARCRLTNHGHELLDLLRRPKILEKIKDLAISSAFEAGKKLLIHEIIDIAAA